MEVREVVAAAMERGASACSSRVCCWLSREEGEHVNRARGRSHRLVSWCLVPARGAGPVAGGATLLT